MSVLEVPGARLHYEAQGSGPVMLMVPGSNGAADVFRRVSEHLSAHYTVVLYDRRGFSRSQLDGVQDYDRRLETDADDVRRLIEHVSDEPATVFGVSSGGLVGMEVLTNHPSVVHTLVSFEPPAVKQLPDGQKWLDFFYELYDLYRDAGIEPALRKFREQAFAESDLKAMARAREAMSNEYAAANAIYWFEHELRQYPAADLDLDALTARADRIVLMGGRDSPGHPAYEVNVVLAEKLELDLIDMPGGHVGCMAQPAEFATELTQALTPAARAGQ